MARLKYLLQMAVRMTNFNTHFDRESELSSSKCWRKFVKISMTTSKLNVYFFTYILAVQFGMESFATNVRNMG